jgi:hypothetical protein
MDEGRPHLMSHVSNTYEPRLQTSRERMRLSQIRKSFDAGVKQREESKDVPVTFFVACVDYIKASMDRLHDQDQRIHDFLIPHVTNGDEHADILENLNMRLARSRDALEDLVKASAVYESSSDDGWAAFKTAVSAFMEVYFKILLSAQHSTLTLQEEVFDESTWDKVAGVTPDSLATEEKLYSKVKGLAPAGADPASFIGGPPAPGAGPPGQKS